MILCFLGLSSGGELSCLFLFDQYCNEIDFAKKKELIGLAPLGLIFIIVCYERLLSIRMRSLRPSTSFLARWIFFSNSSFIF